MKTFLSRASAAAAMLGAASTSLAHPGHGVTAAEADSVTHYVLEPVHAMPLMVLVLGIIAAGGVAWAWRKR